MGTAGVEKRGTSWPALCTAPGCVCAVAGWLAGCITGCFCAVASWLAGCATGCVCPVQRSALMLAAPAAGVCAGADRADKSGAIGSGRGVAAPACALAARGELPGIFRGDQGAGARGERGAGAVCWKWHSNSVRLPPRLVSMAPVTAGE